MDGSSHRFTRPRAPPAEPVFGIWVHAGAGFHSLQNEKIHLDACANAVRAAYRLLADGSPAVDAVEIAIRVMEDNEVCNAGFGSNCTRDGIVEGDASIVDHFGQSGACAAVPNVKNPISLARVILLDSISPHTIQPCPPNLLCGVAATKYAQERRLVVVPNKDLLAPSAWERHRRWMYEAHCMANDIPVSSSSHSMAVPAEPAPVARITMGNDDDAGFPRAESSIGGIFDAENPDSTCLDTELMAEVSTDPEGQYPPAEIRGLFETPSTPPPLTPRSHAVIYTGRALVEEERPHRPLLPTAISVADIPTPATAVGSASMKPGERISHSAFESSPTPAGKRAAQDGGIPLFFDEALHPSKNLNMHIPSNNSADRGSAHTQSNNTVPRSSPADFGRNASQPADKITDTVGAIAIDRYGNIAAGSSSGGTGMKTPGRVGPAALIGIGTHVIPIDGSDSDGTTVAAVTSGTGEHIAATMAARVSAEYMYHSGRDGTGDEHEAIQNVVNHKFMRHPAVLRSFTGASLGVMTIKKSRNSIKFYFAHNTASFALASYTSVDRRPRTVMSRKSEGRNVAIGAKVWLYGTQPNADTTA